MTYCNSLKILYFYKAIFAKILESFSIDEKVHYHFLCTPLLCARAID